MRKDQLRRYGETVFGPTSKPSSIFGNAVALSLVFCCPSISTGTNAA